MESKSGNGKELKAFEVESNISEMKQQGIKGL